MRPIRIPTTLKVVSGLNTPAATTRMPSSAAQTAQSSLALATRSWGTIGDLEQQQWNAAAAKWGPSVGLSAKGAFVYRSLVLTKLVMGESIAFDHVPDVPDTAPATPDFTLEASVTETGILTLGIVCDAAAGPFLVASTPSQSRGTSRFSQGMYRNLFVAGQFTDGSNDIAARFRDVFVLTPSVGTKISVQITPLTANGFRGVPVSHYVVVQPAPGLSVSE